MCWDELIKKDYDNIIEDMEHDFIKLDDGTTIFNVFLLGQRIFHDFICNEYFDDEDTILTEEIIVEYCIDFFQDIIDEIKKEVQYQAINNNICTEVVIE